MDAVMSVLSSVFRTKNKKVSITTGIDDKINMDDKVNMVKVSPKTTGSTANRILLVGCSLDENKEILSSLEAVSDLVVALPTISTENTVAMIRQLHIGYLIICKRIGIVDVMALIRPVREANKDIKVILYFDWSDERADLKYLINGMDACVHRLGSDSSSLLAAIKAAEVGDGIYLSSIVLELLKRHLALDAGYGSEALLSRREQQVVNFILSGLTVKEIANLTKLSTSAISTYKRRLLKKLGVKNVVELISLEGKR